MFSRRNNEQYSLRLNRALQMKSILNEDDFLKQDLWVGSAQQRLTQEFTLYDFPMNVERDVACSYLIPSLLQKGLGIPVPE